MTRNSNSPTQAKTGDGPTEPNRSSPVPHEDVENTASTLIEAPVKPGAARGPKQHDFPDGGGSGGAEAFRARKN
ncbi:MAG TPA: hypothetical protein VE934_17775 [Polaromonas sp.]|uniref:hypothetical protein n=1 Tax=Polaromonas sp. TaxID=1869339 RepID=UPI002D2A1506|nr:hypothetical protein [Polaromonas sp.]HYW58804.1 hypothetical protein [Polaromonas sp.]